jgi:pimeloyl-ACP methyl ester carboxylesterase
MPFTRRLAVMASAVVATVALAGPATAESGSSRAGHRVAGCSRVTVPVQLGSGGQAEVTGTLCRPASPNGTVQVLLSGLTYDAHYWTLPPVPGQSSYVTDQNARGFTTLTVDRLGTGGSDRPPADAVTYAEDLESVHQMVTRLRAGVGGTTFSRIFLVGHSYGAGEAVGEAALYQDVTGVVLTGFAHANGPKSADLPPALVPASTDPITRLGDPPDGYLTTAAGKRSSLFYDTADASAVTIVADEATKSTMTTGEQNTAVVPYDPAIAAAVTAPTLIALGGKDGLVCGGPYLACSSGDEVAAYERYVFTGSARLDGYVLPGSGHSMNLARNAAQWYAEAAGWMNSVSG